VEDKKEIFSEISSRIEAIWLGKKERLV